MLSFKCGKISWRTHTRPLSSRLKAVLKTLPCCLRAIALRACCAEPAADRWGSSTAVCCHRCPGRCASSSRLLGSPLVSLCICLCCYLVLGVFEERNFLHCETWATYWDFWALAVKLLLLLLKIHSSTDVEGRREVTYDLQKNTKTLIQHTYTHMSVYTHIHQAIQFKIPMIIFCEYFAYVKKS